MVEWSREYYIDPSTTGLNAVYRSETAAEGDSNNNTDGVAVLETLEPQPGRHLRGSFSTLRSETGNTCSIIIIIVVMWCQNIFYLFILV